MWAEFIGKHVIIRQRDGWLKHGKLLGVDDSFITLSFDDGRVQAILKADITRLEVRAI